MGCRNRHLSEHRTTALKQWNKFFFWREVGAPLLSLPAEPGGELSAAFFYVVSAARPLIHGTFLSLKKLLVYIFDTLQVLILSSKCEFLNYLQQNEVYQHLNKK